MILNEGPLNSTQQAMFDELHEASLAQEKLKFAVKFADVSKKVDEAVADMWKELSDGAGPLMVILYPDKSQVPVRVAHSAATLRRRMRRDSHVA